MDILTHTLSGIAVGTVIATYAKKGTANKLTILGMGALGGLLPDFDAISLWSKFDSTLGSLFNLSHSGKDIYFSTFWYSHHAFLHSLLAGLIIGVIIYLSKCAFNKQSIYKSFRSNGLIALSFFLGFTFHLLEDMPTPHCVWGGVNLFCPSDAYIGGSGDIWWWNNYDIFLIVLLVIIINLTIMPLKRIISLNVQKITLTVFIVGFAFSLLQIKTRLTDFNYHGYTNKFDVLEDKSKEEQKRILGKTLYGAMEKLDNKLIINF